jgi:glyoxylase-like metal-dependent hydrolase (beta-lactamase superfamily II)
MTATPIPIRNPRLSYPFDRVPDPGETFEVAPGVFWLRMPLPLVLNHINLWLLADDTPDGRGWTIVDTGFPSEETHALWETVLAGRVPGRAIVTHFHPDHFGCALWLAERYGADVWMSEAEYLIGHAVLNDVAGYDVGTHYELLRRHGLDEALIAELSTVSGLYRGWMKRLPMSYRRMIDGDVIRIGGRDWRAIEGHGHSPEHIALYCEELKLLIGGDMMLPKITTNVSVRAVEPDGDPLRLFLDSLDRFATLPADTLVLPSHGDVFRGLHARIDELRAHHASRLAEILDACREPRSACDIAPLLFRRPLEGRNWMFAMGESVAHLNRLMHEGRVVRSRGADGIYRFDARVRAPVKIVVPSGAQP